MGIAKRIINDINDYAGKAKAPSIAPIKFVDLYMIKEKKGAPIAGFKDFRF